MNGYKKIIVKLYHLLFGKLRGHGWIVSNLSINSVIVASAKTCVSHMREYLPAAFQAFEELGCEV